MDVHEIQRAVEGIADTMASIESGSLEATPTQRAYLAGALHALRAVLGQDEPSF